jgi:hypothetical protein
MQTKCFLTAVLIFLLLSKANAQTWSTLGGNMYLSSGNLGIGTSTPGFVITVNAGLIANTISPLGMFGFSGLATDRSIVFEQLGNSSSATQYFFLNGTLGTSSAFGSPTLTSAYAPSFGFESNDNNLNIITGTNGTNITPVRAMSFLPSGNVLIGKTTQTNSSYKLDVNGSVRVNEIVVNLTGADYVFGGDYKLLSLQAVEAYIKEHHHLPEIAPARQMQDEGVNLGENQTALLRKIEELTLYVIQQNKKLERQQKRIDKLEKFLKQKGAK